MYSVRILDEATRELGRLGKAVARRIARRVRWLAKNTGHIKPEALRGELTGLYKVREGDYRIIYQLVDSEKLLIIHAIGHRREIYRKRK